VEHSNYPDSINNYIDIIKRSYNEDQRKKNSVDSYVTNGGWNARKNGRDLVNNPFRCIEKFEHENLIIEVTSPSSDWLEWIKTLGDLHGSEGKYTVLFDEDPIAFSVKTSKGGYVVTISEQLLKDRPAFSKMFRQVFRKSSYCNGCRVCETNCKNGCISFDNGKVKITNCKRCRECHSIDSGCLAFHSLRQTQGAGKIMKSLNAFANHAPKSEWISSFFDLKEKFFSEHTLGPMQANMFKRFLKDASLSEKNHFTTFAELISEVGWETDTAQGMLLINLVCENAQIEWYVNNFELGHTYSRQTVEDMLTVLEVKPNDAKSIGYAYKRLIETPLGTNLHFGYVTDNGDLVRTKCSVSDPLVLLYGLYKFSEKCNAYKEFTLGTLLNDSIERDGISPTRIFGLDREDMIPMLLGLTAKYPGFINASFTHDLEKITLAENKHSADVLDLFKRENAND
jgi:phosphoadenosine phosphosulfate reductase